MAFFITYLGSLPISVSAQLNFKIGVHRIGQYVGGGGGGSIPEEAAWLFKCDRRQLVTSEGPTPIDLPQKHALIRSGQVKISLKTMLSPRKISIKETSF